MITDKSVEVFDDFDIAKIDEGLTPQAKEIMDLLDNKIFVIDDIIAEGIRLGEERGDPDYYTVFYQDF